MRPITFSVINDVPKLIASEFYDVTYFYASGIISTLVVPTNISRGQPTFALPLPPNSANNSSKSFHIWSSFEASG